MRPITSTVLSALLILILSTFSALAATIHVPDDQPTIQAGIDAAADGDLILVSYGTYVENFDFLGKAITVKSEDGYRRTVIDGSRGGSVVVFSNPGDDAVVLDGFTIRNGSGTYGHGERYYGGGIYCGSASPTITNCAISNNFASYGGGIFGIAPTITNCEIMRNEAVFRGGGIYCGPATITNCTITENRAFDFEGGGIYCHSSPTITNSILWGNTALEGPEIFGPPAVSYSDVQGGWPGEGNIDSDPLFFGDSSYHLKADSPCIDTGTPVPVDEDIDGDPRPWWPDGGRWDMGSDEYKDEDGDGFSTWIDCLDTDPLVNPGWIESDAMGNCHNGLDDDCDGLVDITDPDCCGGPLCCRIVPDSRGSLILYLLPTLVVIYCGSISPLRTSRRFTSHLCQRRSRSK